MAKARDSIYKPGRRGTTWLKIKIRPEQELVVGRLDDRQGLRRRARRPARRGLRGRPPALRRQGRCRVHRRQRGRTCWRRWRRSRASEPAARSAPPTGRLGREANWVRPELVVRAEFAGWTGDGQVRQAAFKGVDFGKDPLKVVREAPPA